MVGFWVSKDREGEGREERGKRREEKGERREGLIINKGKKRAVPD
jgi:hypothetical protein